MHHLEIRSFMTGPEMLIRARACAGSAGAPSRFRFFSAAAPADAAAAFFLHRDGCMADQPA
jgi:hypothetical protein